MNKNLKKRWVKWLRSGRYFRTQRQLVNTKGNAFCCLGVLADIQGCKWDGRTPFLGDVRISADSGGNPSKGFNGAYIQPKYAGGLDMTFQRKLAFMNDSGVSFKKIADWIVKNVSAE